MAIDNEELAFNAAYCQRVKALRSDKGWTAAQMAKALGIPAERYRKYENRSPLPPYLMERFCLICDVTLNYLISGEPTKRSTGFRVIDSEEPRQQSA